MFERDFFMAMVLGPLAPEFIAGSRRRPTRREMRNETIATAIVLTIAVAIVAVLVGVCHLPHH